MYFVFLSMFGMRNGQISFFRFSVGADDGTWGKTPPKDIFPNSRNICKLVQKGHYKTHILGICFCAGLGKSRRWLKNNPTNTNHNHPIYNWNKVAIKSRHSPDIWNPLFLPRPSLRWTMNFRGLLVWELIKISISEKDLKTPFSCFFFSFFWCYWTWKDAWNPGMSVIK